MRIYCSGPIANMPDHNRPAFNAAVKRLRGDGHFVINPHELSWQFGTPEGVAGSFAEYYRMLDLDANFFNHTPATQILERTRIARSVLDADLAAVRSCDAIYLLRGWETSRGAKKELAEAIEHGLKVMQEGEEHTVFTKVEEIAREMVCGPIPRHRHDRELLRHFAARISEIIKVMQEGAST